MQRDFLDSMGPMGHLLKTVLDICPDVFSWFADLEDRLMFVSRMNVEMCNLGSEWVDRVSWNKDGAEQNWRLVLDAEKEPSPDSTFKAELH